MLFYDERDHKVQQERGLELLYWLDDLGAAPITEAKPQSAGFVFAGARPIEDYRRLLKNRPKLSDQPENREPLLDLEVALCALRNMNVQVPQAHTWYLQLDEPIPADISYPLFLRTGLSSWKLGGRISKVNNQTQLEEESANLRRAFVWNATVLARQWLNFEVAGESTYGPVPQEVRVWIVDQMPYAWSFHHSQIIPNPRGFPISRVAEKTLFKLASEVGKAFQSRLAVADFAPVAGVWHLVEVGPGSAAGTDHEAIFKSVATFLDKGQSSAVRDSLGATFE